jgi:hypothetical protein
MSDDAEFAGEAVYRDLVDAIFDVDADAVGRFTSVLLSLLTPEEAVEVADDLLDGYFAEAEEGTPGDYVDAVRRLTLQVLVTIGERFDHPIFSVPYVQWAIELIDDDPAGAETAAARGVQLADNPDQAATAGAWQALALLRADEPTAALQAAREAHRLAKGEFERRFTVDVLLEVLCDLDDPDAGPLARGMLAECPVEPDETWDDLGQAITRALLAEMNRLENTHVPISAELRVALRRCLNFPSWTPAGLSYADIAAVVAWADFLGEDLSTLDATLALAGDGPFVDDTVAAQVALLRVFGAYQGQDLEGMEMRLRAAAPAVQRANSSGVWMTFRSLEASLAASLRGGDFEGAIGVAADALEAAGIDVSPSMTVFPRAYTEVSAVLAGQATGVSPATRADLDAWCAGPHDGDGAEEGILWAMSAVVCFFEGDLRGASDRLDRFQQFSDSLPPSSMHRSAADTLLSGLRPGLTMATDPTRGLADFRATHDDHMRGGRPFAAFITAVQLAVGYLGIGDSRESLRYGVHALSFLRDYRAGLAGSSERFDLHSQQAVVYKTVLKAAHFVGDPLLMAEVLEFLRAQDMPVVLAEPDHAFLPFTSLMNGVAQSIGAGREQEFSDAVTLSLPSGVVMPWGRIALAGLLAEDAATSVPLVVPRAPR